MTRKRRGLSTTQHRALGALSEQPESEWYGVQVPAGAIQPDKYGIHALGVKRPTYKGLLERGLVEEFDSAQGKRLARLTADGDHTLAQLDANLREQVAAELEQDPLAITQDEYNLINHLVYLCRQAMDPNDWNERDYLLRVRLVAKGYLRQEHEQPKRYAGEWQVTPEGGRAYTAEHQRREQATEDMRAPIREAQAAQQAAVAAPQQDAEVPQGLRVQVPFTLVLTPEQEEHWRVTNDVADDASVAEDIIQFLWYNTLRQPKLWTLTRD